MSTIIHFLCWDEWSPPDVTLGLTEDHNHSIRLTCGRCDPSGYGAEVDTIVYTSEKNRESPRFDRILPCDFHYLGYSDPRGLQFDMYVKLQ